MSPISTTQDLVTIATVNFTSVYGDAKATLDKMTSNVIEAAAQGADLVVFPELALLGCGGCTECAAIEGACEKHQQLAETVPGPSSIALAEESVKMISPRVCHAAIARVKAAM